MRPDYLVQLPLRVALSACVEIHDCNVHVLAETRWYFREMWRGKSNTAFMILTIVNSIDNCNMHFNHIHMPLTPYIYTSLT